MDPVVVVGAGIAGVACARTLLAAGQPVRLIDRGRRIGGRMAVTTVDGRPVDIGASYLTVSDERFAAVVTDWQRRGLARPWTDHFDVFTDGEPARPAGGPVRWGAPGGLRSLVVDLAAGLNVETATVSSVDGAGGRPPTLDGRPVAAIVLAMPDPQAARLLSPQLTAVRDQLVTPFDPVLAVAVGWSQRGWRPDLDGAFVNGDPCLSWIADDGRRRGDGAAVLVAHSTPAFAAQHLADPEAAGPPLVAAVRRLLGIDAAPDWTRVHRWSFAKPAGGRPECYHLDESLIGLCGDSWSQRPRVEGAYLSGVALADALVARLGAGA